MKRLAENCLPIRCAGRSREGAWIEKTASSLFLGLFSVAPVRERGLKKQILQERNLLAEVAPVRERGLKKEDEQM